MQVGEREKNEGEEEVVDDSHSSISVILRGWRFCPVAGKYQKGGDFSLVRLGFSARCSDTRVGVLIFRYLLALKKFSEHIFWHVRFSLDVFNYVGDRGIRAVKVAG